MEFKLLYWKHLLNVQFLCVCVQAGDATIKFIEKNHQSTFECFIEKQEIKFWQVGTVKISSPKWVPFKTTSMEASVNSDKINILNLNVTSNDAIKISCKSTEKSEKFLALPLFNDNKNLYPSSETPNPIKDKKFTLICKTDDTGVIWFTGNGSVIAKYIGLFNQNYSRYFGSRQETHCQNKICTLSITSVSLDDNNTSIVCKTKNHTSLFKVTLFDPPVKKITLNVSGGKVCAGTSMKFQCSWKGGNPPASVTLIYKNISNTSKEDVELTVTPRSHQIVKCLGFHITANVSHEKNITVCYVPDITAPEEVTLFENQASIVNCSAKGNPIPEVRLECRNQSFPSNSPFTFSRSNISDVFCVANAKSTKHGNLTSRKKINIVLKYPPQVNINISEGIYNATIINCTAFDGNPATYEYKLKQKWGNATKNTYNKNLLSINGPSFNNSGMWECHVYNKDFQVNKSSSYKIPVKPIFSSIFNNTKRNVSNGETVIFKQCFYSHPKSDVKWQKNEELIDSVKYSTTDYLSNEFPFKGSCTSLKIENIKDNDFGIYVLTLENSIGKEGIIFTLSAEEITKVFLGTTIGCIIGIVLLLIILGLLAYKHHKIRVLDGAYNNLSKKPEAVDDRYVEVSDLKDMCLELPGGEHHYSEICEHQSIFPELPVMKEEHAEDNEPKYICMKQPVMKEEHAEDNEPKYICMKQPVVKEEHAEDSEPKYICMKQPALEALQAFDDDKHAEVSEPRFVCMKQPDMDNTYVNVSKKLNDMDVAYVNLPRRPNDTVNDSLDNIYENNNQRN